MIKKYLPTIRQVSMKIGKGIVRLTFWGLFFSVRMFLCYSLWHNLTHNHHLSLFVGFWLACGTDFLFTDFFKII